MKKVFLLAYIRKNLGDDLYIKMLTEKYQNVQFYLRVDTDEYIDNLNSIPNLHISIEKNLKDALYNSDLRRYDAYIYIGGSIFIEPVSKPLYYDDFDRFLERCKRNNIPFFYVSCNFGPFYTDTYLEYSKRIFQNCTDICFRDKYSYNLFKDIPTVRYAPDYVFNYTNINNEKIENSVGISVLDLSKRQFAESKKSYYLQTLEKSIKEFLSLGKKVYLYSFCKYEGDENTIDWLIEKFNFNDNIIPVKYDGNLDNFIEQYSKMEYSICSRFHSFVLSSLLGQKSFIISYSSKTNNVLSDLQFDIPIVDINEMEDSKAISLDDFKIANNTNLSKAIIEARSQEKAIAKFLEEKD